MTLKIRKYQEEDCLSTIQLFRETVLYVNIKDYSEKQVQAWVGYELDPVTWNNSLKNNYSVVTIKDNIIVGFGDMDKSGYLDRLFVHKDYQGQNIATKIMINLESYVNTSKFTSHVSITARPLFENRGYHVVKENLVKVRGVTMKNFIMEKDNSYHN